jgi:hypothetical protein
MTDPSAAGERGRPLDGGERHRRELVAREYPGLSTVTVAVCSRASAIVTVHTPPDGDSIGVTLNVALGPLAAESQ